MPREYIGFAFYIFNARNSNGAMVHSRKQEAEFLRPGTDYRLSNLTGHNCRPRGFFNFKDVSAFVPPRYHLKTQYSAVDPTLKTMLPPLKSPGNLSFGGLRLSGDLGAGAWSSPSYEIRSKTER